MAENGAMLTPAQIAMGHALAGRIHAAGTILSSVDVPELRGILSGTGSALATSNTRDHRIGRPVGRLQHPHVIP